MAVFTDPTDPKTINIDIGGTGVMCLKVQTYDEMAVFFEEPGITFDQLENENQILACSFLHAECGCLILV